MDFVQVEVKRHLHTHDPQSPRDFIDCYITELKNNENQFMTEKGEWVLPLELKKYLKKSFLSNFVLKFW